MRAIGFPTFRYKLVCFVDRRRAVRARRRAARQSHQFHQPGDDALDALGRSHRHGGPRRHGLAVRAADRRGDVSAAGRSAVARDRISGRSVLGPVLLLVAIFARGGIDGLLAGRAPWLNRCSQIERLDASASAAWSRPTRSRSTIARRRVACGHRPERRRQDHADRPTRRRDSRPTAARIRFDGGDITRLARLSPQPARARALVSDHLAVPRFHRARQCRARGAGACAAIRFASGAMRATRRLARPGARGARRGRACRARRRAASTD